MEHHLSKLTTSSLVSDYVGTLTFAGIADGCIDAASYTALSGQSHPVYTIKDGTRSHVTMAAAYLESICKQEFYGVPADVIRSLIREHLPEYIL